MTHPRFTIAPAPQDLPTQRAGTTPARSVHLVAARGADHGPVRIESVSSAQADSRIASARAYGTQMCAVEAVLYTVGDYDLCVERFIQVMNGLDSASGIDHGERTTR